MAGPCRLRRNLHNPLLLVTFICSLLGSESNPSKNQAPSRVNGIQGGSVLLQINISSLGNMVNETEWEFQSEGSSRSLMIANFRGGKTERPDPSDRFGERLEAINETTLRIKDLKLEDGGIYEARARLNKAENEKYKFSLTVHEPVPEPRIRPQIASDTPAGCNVTLQCQASGQGEFSVSWRRGSPPRNLEGDTGWYQLSANGTDLHLFWKPNPLDSNFTCVVSNAIDQRKVSFDLLSICSYEDRNRTQRLGLLLLLSLLGVLVSSLAGAFGIWQWKKRKKLSHNVLSEGSPAALQYAEITKRRRPQEENEDQDPDHLSPSLDQKYSTVYAQLSMPLHSSEQVT